MWNSTEAEYPLEEKCAEAYDIILYRKDLLKLRADDWVNDEIINFYLAMLVDRSKKVEGLPKVCVWKCLRDPTLCYVTVCLKILLNFLIKITSKLCGTPFFGSITVGIEIFTLIDSRKSKMLFFTFLMLRVKVVNPVM